MAPLSRSSSSSGGLEAKHYILIALAATLVAAAVVTVVAVALSPARIDFSIARAESHPSGDGGVQLNLTISLNNTSGRAAVRYQSMFVDVRNSTGPNWVHWLRADMAAAAAAAMPLRQPVRNVTEIHASVALVGGPWANEFTGNKTSHGFTVMITALARFKVGISWTRLYDIKVSCGPVDFFAGHSSAAGCHAAA